MLWMSGYAEPMSLAAQTLLGDSHGEPGGNAWPAAHHPAGMTNGSKGWPSALMSFHQDHPSTKETNMHAVVRTYSGAGAKELFDVLEERKADVQSTLQKVAGMVSYTLIRLGDGGMSVTVCADKAGTDESLKVAREWIAKNASGVKASPPDVKEGTVIVQFS
jgi:hypothetical protein